MVQPYPLPRSYRQTDPLVFDGVSTVYGPFGAPSAFDIFDAADVDVEVKAEGGDWVTTTATVAKTTAEAMSPFTVTFPSVNPSSSQFRLKGRRLHERSLDVTKGVALSADKLELELSKQGVCLQELRRDVDDAATTADIADITAALAGVDAARDEAAAAADEAEAAAATLGGLLDVPAIEELEVPSTIAIISAGDLSVNQALVNTAIASLLGAASGIAPLGSDSKIAAAYLPSYVDDVVEAATVSALPATGEAGKIYVALDTGKTWRWAGSTYAEISASPGSTDAVPEGTANLYFTNDRVRAALAASPLLTV